MIHVPNKTLLAIQLNEKIEINGKNYKVIRLANRQGGLSMIFELKEIGSENIFFLKIGNYPNRRDALGAEDIEALALTKIAGILSREGNTEIKPIEIFWNGDVTYNNESYHAILTKKLPAEYKSIAANLKDGLSLTDVHLAINFLTALTEFIDNAIKAGFATRDFKFDSIRMAFINGYLSCYFLDANIGTLRHNDQTYTCQEAANVTGSSPTEFPLIRDHVMKRLHVSFELEADAMKWGGLVLASLIIFGRHPLILVTGNERIEILMKEFLDRTIDKRSLSVKFESLIEGIISGNASFSFPDSLKDGEMKDLYLSICNKMRDLLLKYSIAINAPSI